MDGEMDAEREKTTAEREVRVDGKRKFEVRVRFEPRGSSDVRRKLGKPPRRRLPRIRTNLKRSKRVRSVV